jgi:hypothetical protein
MTTRSLREVVGYFNMAEQLYRKEGSIGHLHVSTALCIDFIALMALAPLACRTPDVRPGNLYSFQPCGSWTSAQHGLFMLSMLSEVGWPWCYTCIHRFCDALPIGLHEGRELLASSGFPYISGTIFRGLT